MSYRSSLLGVLIGACLVIGVAAGLYFFTDTGKNIVDKLLDKNMPTGKSAQISLMAPFKSYMSVNKVRDILSQQEYYVESSSNVVPKVGSVPAKNLDTLIVESFKHFDVSGKLTLEFLNNELYEVEFSPYVAEDYVSIARNKLGLRPNPAKNGRSERIVGNKRISSNIFLAVTKVGKSLKTKPYVLWQDLHLLTLRRQ